MSDAAQDVSSRGAAYAGPAIVPDTAMYNAASAAAAKRRLLPSRGGGRQKVHRPWTPPEVEALVEGVAHYGCGQWADIKSLQANGVAAALASRSRVDLKDKWRNLLQLASLPSQSRRKAETPPELLQRVLRLEAEFGVARRKGRKANDEVNAPAAATA